MALKWRAGGLTVLDIQSRSILSSLPETMRVPSGLKATLLTEPSWPWSGAPTAWPFSASQSRSVESNLNYAESMSGEIAVGIMADL
jgi:hypothetical protein